MLSRLRGVRLRQAHPQAARHQRVDPEAGSSRRDRVVPRVALFLPVVAVAGLVIALLPGEVTRATPQSTWAALPSTAFESLPSLGRPSAGLAQDGPAAPHRAVGPVSDGGPGIPVATATAVPAPTPPGPPKGPIHIVVAGDDLWTIAARHSAELGAVLRWNEGVDRYRLLAGQRILVPGGSTMASLARPARVTSRPAAVQPVRTARPAATRVRQGDHLWPLAIRGTLTRRFSSAHPGIDIAAARGTRVRAIAGGRVTWSGWKDNGGGYVVEIQHPDGMRSTYNHNSKVTVQRGDIVAQGDTIALVGSTGWSTGPHLDFRVVMGGRLVDPLGPY